jgi:peroxiredoxin
MRARVRFLSLDPSSSLNALSRFAILASALALAAGCASQPPPRSQPSPLLGDLMPSFQSTTLTGNQVISGAYEGHKVVVSFVGVECAQCERILSAAQSVYADDRELIVLGVYGRDDSDKALSIAARLALRFPVVVDRDGSLAKHFKIQNVPTTFVVDQRGRVSWLGGSDVTEDHLSAALSAAE